MLAHSCRAQLRIKKLTKPIERELAVQHLPKERRQPISHNTEFVNDNDAKRATVHPLRKCSLIIQCVCSSGSDDAFH